MIVFRFLNLLILLSAACAQGHEISEYFSAQEEGAFLLLDLAEDKRVIEYHPQLCETRLSPCSTFKIPNALIGIDLGILQDETTLYKWDGSQQLFTIWERDHTLESAVHYSAVWYFQKLAEEIGANEYRDYLMKFHYGNRDISSGLTHFWLGKSLLISPVEQLNFLANLYRGNLPVTLKALETVKKILILERTPTWILSGKTGTNYEQHLGWFVGHIRVGEKEYVFVTCMRGGNASGTRAKTVAQEILQDLFNHSE